MTEPLTQEIFQLQADNNKSEIDLCLTLLVSYPQKHNYRDDAITYQSRRV